MQYVSGVWQSLTGHSIVKRKRSDEEAAALPDRMTSLKLHADQNPGYNQGVLSSANLPESSCDIDSSVASGSHFQDSYLQHSSKSFTRRHAHFKQHSHLNQATANWTAVAPQHSFRAQPSASYSASLTNTVHFQQGSVAQQTNLSSNYTHHTDHGQFRQPAPRPGFSNTQLQAGNCQPQQQQLSHSFSAKFQLLASSPAADANLFCSEAFSPDDIPSQPSLYSPDLALSESVADSPDDIELLVDEVTQSNSPFAQHSMSSAFLAICKSPQVTTALSKLLSSNDLPGGCAMLPLPMAAQYCGIAMTHELSTAASAQTIWNTASQLDWTVAAMFALCQRAKLCEQELDATVVLSILWILECCSSQISSTVPTVTARYLDYTCYKAAAAGPRSPSQIRIWQNDLKTAQLEVLTRCNWRMHLDFEADLVPALHQLQQLQGSAELLSVVQDVQAGSKHRAKIQAQMKAKAAQQAQHVTAQQHQKQQQQQKEQQQRHQMHEVACCQSSTKPARPPVRHHHTDMQMHAQHTRLRQQAEDLSQSSLDGKYWQSSCSSSCSHSEASHMAHGQRTRHRSVRVKSVQQEQQH